MERICALTAKLLKDKQEVHLVVFDTTESFYDVTGIDLIELKSPADSNPVKKILNLFRRIQRLKKIKKELGIELSYSFGTSANLVNALSKVQDVTWAGIRGYGALEEVRRMKVICRKADRVVSCTKVMEQDIVKLFQTKNSGCLYNPCDIDQIIKERKLPLSEEQEAFFEKPGFTIASMGREDDIKGYWHLIKSVALVRQELPDTKLVIIGYGEFTEYKQLAKELGMEEDVLFTGVMKNPHHVLRHADLYALTSDSEGFPNALIEAMAVGVPCVSVNCKTGPAEILGKDHTAYGDEHRVYEAEYGILTPVLNRNKNLSPEVFEEEEKILAAMLAKVLRDEALRNRYKQAGMKRAAEFSNDAYVGNFEKLLQEDL